MHQAGSDEWVKNSRGARSGRCGLLLDCKSLPKSVSQPGADHCSSFNGWIVHSLKRNTSHSCSRTRRTVRFLPPGLRPLRRPTDAELQRPLKSCGGATRRDFERDKQISDSARSFRGARAMYVSYPPILGTSSDHETAYQSLCHFSRDTCSKKCYNLAINEQHSLNC
ncbi:hypothetical protein GWI33_010452 [Rhynchophorus ferrugineus]|uniref:Uncharacterized protein n=1 Tax=Rhynchophorus ferrugineus TaxID=354439 RepID=A0A834MDZ5_RHYFE|nr:hypothetical protein GWI33_010452 [Rhynchophorus ferrugineus]